MLLTTLDKVWLITMATSEVPILGEVATIALGKTDEEASVRDEIGLTDIILEDTSVIDEVGLIETLEGASVTDEIGPIEMLKEGSIATDEVEPMGTLEVVSITDKTGPMDSLLEEILLVIIGPIVAVIEGVWIITLELKSTTDVSITLL